MPFEHSAGAVIFRQEGSEKFYLLLQYPGSPGGQGYWDFAKGHLEKGETELDTVRREVEEETGLTGIEIYDGFKEWIKYFFKSGDKFVSKIVTFFVAETKNKEVRVSFEHTDFIWLPYEEALAKLTYENARGILRKAYDFLLKRSAEADKL